jgi:hypothetical protein
MGRLRDKEEGSMIEINQLRSMSVRPLASHMMLGDNYSGI